MFLACVGAIAAACPQTLLAYGPDDSGAPGTSNSNTVGGWGAGLNNHAGGQGGGAAPSGNSGAYSSQLGEGGQGASSGGAPGGMGGAAPTPVTDTENTGLLIGNSGARGTAGSGGGGGGAGVIVSAVPVYTNNGHIVGGNGASAGNGVDIGGTGGGGVGAWVTNGATLINAAGAEVRGGSGSGGLGGLGAEGGGGAGVVLDGVGTNLINYGTLRAGASGGSPNVPELGVAKGGAGVIMAGSRQSLTNWGVIEGGQAYLGGVGALVLADDSTLDLKAGSTLNASAQLGGTATSGLAILGNRNRVVVAGTVSNNPTGDPASNGVGNAISVSGSHNTVELHSTFLFNGNVVSTGAGNILSLGGPTDQSFELSNVVDASDPNPAATGLFRGFSEYHKTGASTWSLTGVTAARGAWYVDQGTLALTGAASLASASRVTVASTLDITGLTGASTTLTALAGGVDGRVVLGDKTLTLNNGLTAADAGNFAGQISGKGGLTVDGGYHILSGQNTYAGGTRVQAGTLQLGDGTHAGGVMGDVAVQAPGTLAFLSPDQSAPSEFSGVISGAGSVSQLGGYTRLTGSNSYTGTTVISAGVLEAGSGSALGTTSGVQIERAGTLALSDAMSMAQPMAISQMSNNGTLQLSSVNASPGRELVINGDYGGAGELVVSVAQHGATGTGTSDLLTLTGKVSGHTGVRVNDPQKLGFLTTGDGIKVIDASAAREVGAGELFYSNGGSKDNPSKIKGGAYEYTLYRGGVKSTDNPDNWYLRSFLNPDPDPDPGTNPGTNPDPGPGTVTYRPGMALNAAVSQVLAQTDLASLGTYRQRLGQLDNGSAPGRMAWGRIVRNNVVVGQNGSLQPRSDSEIQGAQLGQDVWAGADHRVGLYGSWLHWDSAVTGHASGDSSKSVGRLKGRTASVGAYWTYAPASSNWYSDAVVQYSWHRGEAQAHDDSNNGIMGNSVLASWEVGKTIALNPQWSIEPQAQVIARHGRIKDSEISGARLSHRDDDGILARAGLRATGNYLWRGNTLRPYGSLDLLVGGGRANRLTASTDVNSGESFDSGSGSTSARVGLGMQWQRSDRLAVTAEWNRQVPLDRGRATTLRGGSAYIAMRYLW